MGLRSTFLRAARAAFPLGAAKQRPVLWSHETAREIVEAITDDASAGELTPSEVVALADRVWRQTAAEDGKRV